MTMSTKQPVLWIGHVNSQWGVWSGPPAAPRSVLLGRAKDQEEAERFRRHIEDLKNLTLTKIRVTIAAQKYHITRAAICKAKREQRITDVGHGFCYDEEVAEMAHNKAMRSFAQHANEDAKAQRAQDVENSLSYEQAALFYGTTTAQIIKWKRAKLLAGPYNRIWKDQPNPTDGPKNYGTSKTLSGGRGYRVAHNAPIIDQTEW